MINTFLIIHIFLKQSKEASCARYNAGLIFYIREIFKLQLRHSSSVVLHWGRATTAYSLSAPPGFLCHCSKQWLSLSKKRYLVDPWVGPAFSPGCTPSSASQHHALSDRKLGRDHSHRPPHRIPDHTPHPDQIALTGTTPGLFSCRGWQGIARSHESGSTVPPCIRDHWI